MAQTVGQRSTFQISSGQENRHVRSVADEIAMLEPNMAPLLTLLNRMKKFKPIDSPKIEWLEDDFNARWAQMGATTAAANAASTTLVVLDSTLFNPGDVWIACNGNLATHQEGVLVTAINSATQITVTRNFYGGGIGAINANTALRYAGVALEEGAAIPDSRTTIPSTRVSYLQEFSHTVKMTDTAMNTKTYGAPNGEMRRLVEKKMKEHKIAINSALLFSKASESLTGGPGGGPIRTTQGIIPTISSNVTSATAGGGMLTLKLWDSFVNQAFRYSDKREKVLLASPMVTRAINAWAFSKLNVDSPGSVFGVQVQTIVTPFGRLQLINDYMLEDGISGQSGFNGCALALDLDQFHPFYLSGPEGSFNMAYEKDAGAQGVHSRTDEIHSKIGFRIMNEKYHALLMGVTDYQT